jgi:hypothetical protein
VALLWAGALLYFQVHLQSDSVFLEDLSRNLFEEGGDWWWWRLPPAPAYVPDMLLYFLGYGLLPDVTARIFFVSFVQVVLLGLAVMFFVRQLQGRFRPVYQAAALGVVTLITLVSVHSDIWVYFYTTNNHFASYLFPFIALGVIFALIRRFRVVWLLLLVVLSTLGAMSTSLYTLAFAVPVGVVLVSLAIVTRLLRMSTSRMRWTLAAAVASIIAGLVLANVAVDLITPYGANPDRLGFSKEIAIRGLLVLNLVLKYLFGGGGAVVVVFTAILIAATVYVVVAVIRRLVRRPIVADEVITFPFPFPSRFTVPRLAIASSQVAIAITLGVSALSFLLSISVSTFFGGLFDEHGYRYVILSFALTALIASLLLVHSARGRSAVVATTVIAGLLVLASIVSTPIKIAEPRSDAVSTPVAGCLQNLRDRGVTLTAGVGDYWLSRGVALQLENSPPMQIMWGNLNPSHWMNSAEPLVDSKKYDYKYDFAIVNPGSTGEPMLTNADELSKNLPKPTAIYICSTGTEVWTWSDGSLDSALRVHFKQWIIDNHVVRGR